MSKKIFLVLNGDFKTIELPDNSNWANFIQLVAAAVPTYASYSPDIKGTKFLWLETDQAKQDALLVSVRDSSRINLTLRLDGGSVISESTFNILQKNFITKGTCSTCYVPDILTCTLECGCVFCFVCFQTQVHLWESEGVDYCLTHKNSPLSKNLENFVKGNDEAIVNVWRVMSFVQKAKSAAYKAHRCKPEELLVNATGYSRQVCPFCRKPFCFFCGEDWSSDKQNKIFSCGSTCYNPADEKNNIITTLQIWPAKAQYQIPSFRYCPKCGSKGAMGEKCKMNQCKQCSTWYCFYCFTIAPSGAATCASQKQSYEPCPTTVEQSANKIWQLVSNQ